MKANMKIEQENTTQDTQENVPVSREFLDEAYAAMFSNPKFSNYLFYAHILGQCTTRIDAKLPAPAAVAFVDDHFELIVSPKLLGAMPINQRIGVLKHEALHIIHGHLSGEYSNHHRLAVNYAMDCANNQLIDRNDLPDFVIYPDTLQEWIFEMSGNRVKVPVNLSTQEYYDIIMENVPLSEDNGESNCEDGGSGEGNSKPEFVPTEIDSHEMFGSEVSKDFIKERTKDLLEKAKDATLMSNGSLPSNYSDFIEINSPKVSEVPWQKLFQNVSSNTKTNHRATYMRRSRRFKNRREIKGRLPERTFNWLTIADVSGSMSDESVKYCLGEIVHLCKKMNTTSSLIQIDTEPMESIEITSNVKTFERKAMGGTIMYPGILQAEKEKLQYDAVVVLTDGGLADSDIRKFLDVKVPVIWVITDDYNVSLDNFRIGKMKAARLRINNQSN